MPSHITPHPRKRQFQPDITSYFAFRPKDGTTAHPALPRQDSGAQLPEAVQSSLITVGMRVRKAVPEGYPHLKTLNKAYQTPQQSLTPVSAYTHPAQSFLITRPHSQRRHQSRRELEPYSGIHRVGGMFAQPQHYDDGDEEDEEGWDTLGDSSQESFASTVSTDSVHQMSNSHKRAFDEDQDENEYGCSFRLDPDGQTPIFEFGLPKNGDVAARRIAVPASRKGGGGTVQFSHQDTADDFDFGEATFLRFGENDMDVD